MRQTIALALALGVGWSPLAHAGAGRAPHSVGPEPESTAAEGDLGTEPEGVKLPAEAAGPGPEPEDPLRARAQSLYRAGAAMYSAADYAGAIDKFTQALALIADGEAVFDADTRGLLLFNLATAHDRAYNVDADITHLRKAKELLARIAREGAANGYSDALVEQSRSALGEVEARLAEIESEAVLADDVPLQPRSEPGRVDEGPDPNAGRGLIVSGAVMAGTGVAASGLWIAGLVLGGVAADDVSASALPSTESARIDAIARGRTGNTLAIAGAVVSGTLIAVGTVLLAIGVRKRRKVRRLACAPLASPALARIRDGASVGMRVGLSCEVRL